MNVTIARYVLGVASLALIVASLGFAAVTLRRRFFPAWFGALARLAEAVMGLALVIFVLEVLGAIGLFRLVPVVLGCLLACAGVWWAAGGAPVAYARVRRVRGGGAAAVAVLFSATLAAEYASPTLQAYDVGVHVLDSIWYHLPLAASFAQTGYVTTPRYDVEFLTAFYPASAELLHGLGIVLLARDTLTPVLNLLLMGPLLLAAWCIGRARGAGAAAVAGVSLLLATPMMLYSQAGSADNDILGVLFFLAAVVFVLEGEDRPAAYVLAAVASGLAVSVRLTLLAPVAALTVGVIAITPGRRRLALLWLGPLVLAGGYWFLRNLIDVGNPAPWSGLGGLLQTPAPPLQAKVGFTLAHYLGDPAVWNRFWEPALASGLGRWWFVIVGAAILGPILCLLTGPGRKIRMLAVVALVSLGAYLITPESAMGPPHDPVGIAYNLRYAAPGLTLGLALVPIATPLAGRLRQALLIVGAVAVLVATVAQPRLWPDRHIAGAIPVGVVALLLGLGLWIAPRLWLPRRLPVRAALGGVLASLLLAGAAGGYVWQRHYLRGRYAFKPGVSHLARLWAFFRTVHHQRVGLVGTYGAFFSYPLFGFDLSNPVEYVAHRGPHGSFTPIGGCREWRQTVNAGHFRYLVATPARDPFRTKILSPSPEAGWTRSDPAARVVFNGPAIRQRVIVFELSGPLHPDSCR